MHICPMIYLILLNLRKYYPVQSVSHSVRHPADMEWESATCKEDEVEYVGVYV